jgi:sedoheptulokinase
MSSIGIDIGTTTVSGIIRKDSNELLTVTKENSSCLNEDASWKREQDPDAIADVAMDVLGDLLKISGNEMVASIGLSGQMHGILYVDADGKAVSPLFTWQDHRGTLPYKDGETYSSWLSKATGYTVSSGFGLVTHFFNMINGLVPREAARICTIMDYVAMKLSGTIKPKIDASNAASLGFFDLQALSFDKAAIESVGMNPGILPDETISSSVLGSYNGVPVVLPIGDNQASYLGSVKDFHKSLLVNVGTSSQISIFSNEYMKVQSLDTRPLPGGGYILVGAALCGGSTLSILKDFFKKSVMFLTGEDYPDEKIYEAISSATLGNDYESGLDVCTSFDGTRIDPLKMGSIQNIDSTNFTPQNLTIGFMRGICQELFDFYLLLPESLRKGLSILVGTGNALRKNSLLCRLMEEKFGCTLNLSECGEESALGACINGMIGTGKIQAFGDFWNLK